jgi:dTDP-glucose pyrophosphorylase
MTEVQQFLYSLHTAVPLNIVVKTTPSSMHSFHALREFLRGGKFCLTTVDTIFREDEFTDYINTFLADNLHDGLMAVTSFIDDEKPLYVETDADRRITAFADRTLHPQYVSGGIYGLSDRSIAVLERCMQAGQERMRNFQRQLIADGLQLAAMPFSKIIDIDHIEDIEKAGKFLTAERV